MRWVGYACLIHNDSANKNRFIFLKKSFLDWNIRFFSAKVSHLIFIFHSTIESNSEKFEEESATCSCFRTENTILTTADAPSAQLGLKHLL